MTRRSVVKAIAVSSAVMGLGAFMPRIAMAAWNKAAFDAKDLSGAMSASFDGDAVDSADVYLKAPAIAENGAVVPVSISSKIADTEKVMLFIDENPNPLAFSFDVSATAVPEFSTRVRMGKTSMVTAVVIAGGKAYKASSEVKVTIGGCGG